MPQLSHLTGALIGQKMFQIMSRANELERLGHNILHFEIGEPEFRTPTNITDAAVSAIRAGNTRYVNSQGLLELREEARNTTLRSRGFKPALEQILVTPGANAQIYLAAACIVNAGDEVIIPDPSFVSYAAILHALGAVPVAARLREENNFRMDPEEVATLISPATKMIIINSPSNPTGAVATKKEISDFYKLAERHDLFILSDEIYARMIYEDSDVGFFSPSEHDQCQRHSIIVNGFSKSYAMTGWRLGVTTGPPALISKMGLLLETIFSCTPPFIQMAGIEALSGPQDEISEMVSQYRKRRDLITDGLNSVNGFRCVRPDGAFYAFPNTKDTGLSSSHLAEVLMNELGIVVSPGNIFGQHGEGYLRFCYAVPEEQIKAAIERLVGHFN